MLTGGLFLWKSKAKNPQNKVPHTVITQAPQSQETNTPSTTTATPTIAVAANPTPPQKKGAFDKISIPILMYHYIRVVTDPNDKLGIGLSVTPDKFATQLDYLNQLGYKTITFNDVLTGNIPDKPIILTFDDGYQDFYDTAVPELKKHNMTAVSYVIANKIGGAFMTAPEIKELSDEGFEIGSHTLNHIDLSKANTATSTTEITESKSKLETITGKKVVSFCYPSGKYNDETVKIVSTSGYSFATTTNNGIGQFKTPFTLSRYRMNGDTNIKIYIK